MEGGARRSPAQARAGAERQHRGGGEAGLGAERPCRPAGEGRAQARAQQAWVLANAAAQRRTPPRSLRLLPVR